MPTLIIPLMHHSTSGDRAFMVAAAFRRHLKSQLFLQCFVQTVSDNCVLLCSFLYITLDSECTLYCKVLLQS